jgi:hypothetical protein
MVAETFEGMKIPLLLVFSIACWCASAQPTVNKPGPDATIVKVLAEVLPHEEDKKHDFLWDHFANKPEEEQFGLYRPAKWKENFATFAEALVAKAKAQKLDSGSLRKALDKVLEHAKDQNAYLPVGAYQTTLDGRLIWIVAVKWEALQMGEDAPMVHIRTFGFDQKTLELVAYTTCM